MTDGCDISIEIALRWTPLDFSDDKSTLVQVMAWCRQATSHCMNQCWPRSLPPYGVTRPQCVKISLGWMPYMATDPSGPFYSHGLTLILAWISNYMPRKVWDEITYPFLNFNSCTVEVKEWISNFIPHITMDVITFLWWNKKLIMLVKGANGNILLLGWLITHLKFD